MTEVDNSQNYTKGVRLVWGGCVKDWGYYKAGAPWIKSVCIDLWERFKWDQQIYGRESSFLIRSESDFPSRRNFFRSPVTSSRDIMPIF